MNPKEQPYYDRHKSNPNFALLLKRIDGCTPHDRLNQLRIFDSQNNARKQNVTIKIASTPLSTSTPDTPKTKSPNALEERGGVVSRRNVGGSNNLNEGAFTYLNALPRSSKASVGPASRRASSSTSVSLLVPSTPIPIPIPIPTPTPTPTPTPIVPCSPMPTPMPTPVKAVHWFADSNKDAKVIIDTGEQREGEDEGECKGDKEESSSSSEMSTDSLEIVEAVNVGHYEDEDKEDFDSRLSALISNLDREVMLGEVENHESKLPSRYLPISSTFSKELITIYKFERIRQVATKVSEFQIVDRGKYYYKLKDLFPLLVEAQKVKPNFNMEVFGECSK
jgi:hypothetical protein